MATAALIILLISIVLLVADFVDEHDRLMAVAHTALVAMAVYLVSNLLA